MFNFFLKKKILLFENNLYNAQRSFGKKNIIWIVFIIYKNIKIGIGECNSIIFNKKFIKNPYEIKYKLNKLLKLNNKNFSFNYFRNKTIIPSILFSLEQAFLFLKNGNFPILYKSEFTNGIKGIPLNYLLWINICEKNEEKKLYKKIKKKFLMDLNL